MAGYLALKGLQILRNGYNVIPIKPGAKFPVIKNWQNHETKPVHIGSWLSNGHAEAGVGITTGKTVFVDLDTPDLGDALYMEGFIQFSIGFAPVRIGNNPKRGLMFRTDTPFRKVTSKTYVDSQGREHRCEILGIGQQFVSHHIHPDTGKPYLWQQGDGPEYVHVDDLPLITEAQARQIVAVFEKRMIENGFTAKGAVIPANALPRAQQYTVDDELGLDRERLWLSEDVLAAKVRAIPNADEVPYGDDSNKEQLGWFKLLCAIHHETGGSEFGRSLAYEWSIQAPKHTDERFDITWPSLGQRNQGEREITGRYITRWARVFEHQRAAEQLPDLLLRLDIAGSVGELTTIIDEARKTVLDPINQGRLVTCIRQNAKRFGSMLTVKQVRDLIRPEKIEVPDWLNGWVYLSHADRFFNIKNKQMMKERAFDNTFCEFTGDSRPTDIALRGVKVDRAYMAGYQPTAGEFFTMNGHRYANSYSERNVPKVPARLEGQDRENVKLLMRHFENLFPVEREREIAISWFSHIVRTKQRPNWAILMQGVDGDGRSFFGYLMAAVLGGDNVRSVGGSKTLEETYTSWAVGQLFTLIEEVRMIGHNRHDTINRMKPYITNATIEVRDMYFPVYNAPNTTAYMLTTNYGNALPITDADRRYFVLTSQWQHVDAFRKFEAENPGYYANLYNILDESAGAIRGWFMAYKPHPEFQPQGRAPDSTGRQSMIHQNKSDEMMTVEDLIESGFYYDISEDVVVVSKLAQLLTNMYDLRPAMRETGCAAILRMNGFTYIGRIIYEEKKVSVWSRNPQKFQRGSVPATVQITNHLKKPL